MQTSHPLPDTHPELSLIQWRDWKEYRVENSHLARDGSGKVVRGTHRWTWREALVALLGAYLWPIARHNVFAIAGLALALALYVWYKCTQVLFESVVAFYPHGLQLETHRGFPPHPLVASRRFIPMCALQDVIINEALRRWDVRFYLAAMSKDEADHFFLDVAYENILPHFPVLLEVYRGVHDALFPEPESTPRNMLGPGTPVS